MCSSLESFFLVAYTLDLDQSESDHASNTGGSELSSPERRTSIASNDGRSSSGRDLGSSGSDSYFGRVNGSSDGSGDKSAGAALIDGGDGVDAGEEIGHGENFGRRVSSGES